MEFIHIKYEFYCWFDFTNDLFTCHVHLSFQVWIVTSELRISHVIRFHLIFHMWFISHLTFQISNTNFTCDFISHLNFHMWNTDFTCDFISHMNLSHVKYRFHMWFHFTFKFSHVKYQFHMWFHFTFEFSHVKYRFHMWFHFTFNFSHVKSVFHMWFYFTYELFTCEIPISHVKYQFHMWFDFTYELFTCEIPISHVKFTKITCDLPISHVKLVFSHVKSVFHMWNRRFTCEIICEFSLRESTTCNFFFPPSCAFCIKTFSEQQNNFAEFWSCRKLARFCLFLFAKVVSYLTINHLRWYKIGVAIARKWCCRAPSNFKISIPAGL
jgi:hypothetical protein